MDDLIKTLPKVVEFGNASEEVVEAAVFAAWKHVAGQGIRQHAAAQRLEGEVLVIAVRDNIWQKQLYAMNSNLLYRINSVLGKPLVKSIELRINPAALPAMSQSKAQSSEILENEVPIDLWAAAREIEDKQLRQKFLKAATGMLRRKMSDKL